MNASHPVTKKANPKTMLFMRAVRAAAARASTATATQRSAIRAVLTHARFSTQSSVYTWGSGSLGQLGHGAFVKAGIRNAYEELSPKRLEAFEGKSIVKLEFGATHSAAIDDKGCVYTWGSNEYNKLGLGPSTGEFESVPRLMEAFEGIEIVDISCGDYYTAAVDSEGKMYSWGWGGSTMKGAGGLGHAGGKDEPTPRLVRALVDQGVPIASVECGELHTVALSKDGEIWAWGNGEYGRLGNGETDTFEIPEPIEFFSDDNVVAISAGRDFTFALTDEGELYGWGVNSHNQLGVGGGLAMDHYNMEAIPTLVEGFNSVSVKQFAAGYDHAAAVTDDGRLYMWGSKLWLEPHEMTALEGETIVQVACGRTYTVALSADGKVFTFGKGSSNCLGHGDRKNQLQPLQIAALTNINVTSAAIVKQAMPSVLRILVCATLVLLFMLLFMDATRQLVELYDVTIEDLGYLRSNILDESAATSSLPMQSRQRHGRPQKGGDDDMSVRNMAILWWYDAEKWIRHPQWWSSSSDRLTASVRATSENSLAALTALWSHEDNFNVRHRDNDACTRLYVDSKNAQVCIITS
ncbi:Regulator of chromosome condensation, partial [Globisporangium splendens]